VLARNYNFWIARKRRKWDQGDNYSLGIDPNVMRNKKPNRLDIRMLDMYHMKKVNLLYLPSDGGKVELVKLSDARVYQCRSFESCFKFSSPYILFELSVVIQTRLPYITFYCVYWVFSAS
jgi:hypothetical protein